MTKACDKKCEQKTTTIANCCQEVMTFFVLNSENIFF